MKILPEPYRELVPILVTCKVMCKCRSCEKPWYFIFQYSMVEPRLRPCRPRTTARHFDFFFCSYLSTMVENYSETTTACSVLPLVDTFSFAVYQSCLSMCCLMRRRHLNLGYIYLLSSGSVARSGHFLFSV